MTVKSQIVQALGESAVLLPDLVAGALAANDRAKLRLTLLQEAAMQAAERSRPIPDLSRELSAAGLDDPISRSIIPAARVVGAGRLEMPGVDHLIQDLHADIAAMIAPVSTADPAAADPFAKRLAALAAATPSGTILALSAIGRMTTAAADAPDSEHRLIMDLHKAVNRIADQTAVDTVDGARAMRLGPQDRPRLKAFMAGVNWTAPLAFGHPGLGTTAVGDGPRLIIQNDIGATDAHVIVIHVEGLAADVTYTDVHRGRAKFFMDLLDGFKVAWTPLAERSAPGLVGGEAFYLVSGRHEAGNEQALDAFLERLGSRLVFLIDWNKARKILQGFVGKPRAVALLKDAAARDLGHRAFLELGGADLVFDAVRRVAGTRAPYGERLDEVLGGDQAYAFLADVLRLASEGLSSGRSLRLMRDEIQAGLVDRLQSAEGDLIRTTLRHLGLSRMLAGGLRDSLSGGLLSPAAERMALTARATRLEQKGDRITVQARESAGRLTEANPRLRRMIDQAEEALDALDEAAFLFSLLVEPADDAQVAPLAALADITVDSAGQLVRACEAASRAPSDRQQDMTEALQAIDAVCAAERAADTAERRMISALMLTPSKDARAPALGLELAHAVERATDHLAHSALALRDHLLGEQTA